MPRTPRPLPPLDQADLERFALRYVERYATSRARLASYLTRKLRERGWGGAGSPDPEAVAQAMADRGYVDDRLFAESRVRSMGRRGFGARRVGEALRQAGIETEDREALAPALADDATTSALTFARRKRIGPYARTAPDEALRRKQIAAMLRAGHDFALARRIVSMAPGSEPSLEDAEVAGQIVPEWD